MDCSPVRIMSSMPDPITLACLSPICQTEGLRLLRGFHPSAGGPQTLAWPHTPESLQKEEDFCTNFYLCLKGMRDCSFISLLSYCKCVSVCSFGFCNGEETYLVAVVGTQGWGLLPIKLLLPQLGTQSTKLQPTEGSLESSLSCD